MIERKVVVGRPKLQKVTNFTQLEELEQKVVISLASGASDGETAEAVGGFDKNEIKGIIEQIRTKTGMNRVQLAVWYTKHTFGQGGRI